MSSEILVKHVEKSIRALKIQMSKIQKLHNGLHVLREEIHMDEEEHGFEAWLENEGAYLRAHIPGDIVPNIAALHKAWFHEYNKIYQLFFHKASWFGNKNQPNKLNLQELDKFAIYYDDLLEIHKSLVHKFEILLLRVSSSREVDDEDIVTQEKLVI